MARHQLLTVVKAAETRPTTTADDSPQGQRTDQYFADTVADELLTVHDAARLLNVTVSWIYEHTREAAEDPLPFLKLGKYVRFNRADLRDYVNAKRRASHARQGTR